MVHGIVLACHISQSVYTKENLTEGVYRGSRCKQCPLTARCGDIATCICTQQTLLMPVVGVLGVRYGMGLVSLRHETARPCGVASLFTVTPPG